MMTAISLILVCVVLSLQGVAAEQQVLSSRPVCVVKGAGDPAVDDAPNIVQAFAECGHGGKVIFARHTVYNVRTVMNTTGLEDCEIELHGRLLWSTDVEYWLANSLPMGYQNQSTAWIFGGRNIRFRGFHHGTFDGNGQVWYDRFGHISNHPRRPHQITIWETYDSVFKGIRFVQSQMWTMTLIRAANVLLEDIYVNSTSSHWREAPTMNTDGADTIYAKNITFNRWVVVNGDDCISPKANSSDIFVYNSVCIGGSGLALGSIGQFKGEYEYIDGFIAENVTFIDTSWAIYIKTWTGVQKGYPPNGGGGGLGYIKNITVNNAKMVSTRGVFHITQCISFSGQTGDCDTSTFKITDLHWGNLRGTTRAGLVTDFQCSGAAPCERVEVSNINLRQEETHQVLETYRCRNVMDPIGFTCNA